MTKEGTFYHTLSGLTDDFFVRCDYDFIMNIRLFRARLKGLKLRKLQGILTFLETGKSITQKDYAPVETSYIHLVPRDVKEGEIGLRDPIFLTEDKGEELAEFRVKKGDILMVISSNVGDTVRFDLDDETQYTISHYMVRMQIDETQYMPEFLVYYMNHPNIKLYFRAVETGKTQQNLSKTYIYDMPIPDIPKTTQQDIMKGVLEKTHKRSKLKQEIKKLTDQSNNQFWDSLT